MTEKKHSTKKTKKNKFDIRKMIFIFLTICISLGLILYPYIANFVYEHQKDGIVETVEEKVQTGDKEKYEQTIENAKKYNEDLVNGAIQLKDPFNEENIEEDEQEYESQLNMTDDGVMGIIKIPCIDVSLPIYHGTSSDTLEKGVGHLQGTSLPIGGKSTHSVLTGHSGLSRAKLFTDLTAIKEGDLFFIHVAGRRLAYKVDDISVVLPEEMSKLSIVNNKLRLRGVTLSGRDETYTYILAIVSRYEDEAEDIFDLDDEDDYDDLDIDEDLDEISDEIEYPDNVQITLFKYNSVDEAALTSSKCFQYDFEFSKWIPVNVEDISGITAKQESILTGNDKELSRVLSVCIDGLGPMTNKQFENLLAGNKPIIDLYKRTSRFTDIELYDPDTIILIPSMQYEGLSVSYEDGTYRLNSVFLGEVIETVAKIKNIDDIENVLIEMVDKQFYADTIVVTPLSSKAFYVIRSDGASEFFYPEHA